MQFLSDTVQDFKTILETEIHCDDRVIEVPIRCIVCDALARAMVKNVKLNSGYSGCDKCNQYGEYVGRVTYQEIEDQELRTDTAFRDQLDKEHHHNSVSSFCELPVDMVKSFSIDYMHQVCLGSMKKPFVDMDQREK